MKCSFGISGFLEEISSLSHSIVFLSFFPLITEEGFLSLLAILWNYSCCSFFLFIPLQNLAGTWSVLSKCLLKGWVQRGRWSRRDVLHLASAFLTALPPSPLGKEESGGAVGQRHTGWRKHCWGKVWAGVAQGWLAEWPSETTERCVWPWHANDGEMVGCQWRHVARWPRTSDPESAANWVQISPALLTSRVTLGKAPSSLILCWPSCAAGLMRLTFQACGDLLA